jgi:N-acetylmuramoyl-L-alanine amidase
MLYILTFIFIFLFSGIGNCFVVAIDSGHSSKKWGAKSYSGINEHVFNMNIAEKLNQCFSDNEILSFIIDPYLSLQDRAKYASEHADILVSIHHDSVSWYDWYRKNSIKGFSVFVSSKNSHYRESRFLAVTIAVDLGLDGFKYNHYYQKKKEVIRDGVYNYPNLVLLKTSTIPSVLLECGVIVNKNEEKNLRNNEYQDKIVKSLYKSVFSYYKYKYL